MKKVDGYYTVMDSTMTDLEKGHQTRVVIQDIVYDQGLPEELFTQKSLRSAAADNPYRP